MYELRKKNNIFAFGPPRQGLETALDFETRELNVSFSPPLQVSLLLVKVRPVIMPLQIPSWLSESDNLHGIQQKILFFFFYVYLFQFQF